MKMRTVAVAAISALAMTLPVGAATAHTAPGAAGHHPPVQRAAQDAPTAHVEAAHVVTGRAAATGKRPHRPKRAKVVARPSTSAPAAGFEVPIRGTVSGPVNRPVVLFRKDGNRWQLLRVARTTGHQYTFWAQTTNKPAKYRVLAPMTKGGPAGVSRAVTVRPTTVAKPVASVRNATCHQVSPDVYKVHLTIGLITGERVSPDMTLYGAAYIGVLTSGYGGRYNVGYDFEDC